MLKIKLLAALILIASIVIIVLQNTEAVETKILFTTVILPRATLLFGTALIGFILGILVSFLWFKKSH